MKIERTKTIRNYKLMDVWTKKWEQPMKEMTNIICKVKLFKENMYTNLYKELPVIKCETLVYVH